MNLTIFQNQECWKNLSRFLRSESEEEQEEGPNQREQISGKRTALR
jgi:hypothetical protein